MLSSQLPYQRTNNFVSIPSGHQRLPVEIAIIGQFPAGSTQHFVEHAFAQQAQHPEFVEEFYESSALIGKPSFPAGGLQSGHPGYDPTAMYTFGIDTRDLIFHRHCGHRAIIGIAGAKGCILRFSMCTPEEAEHDPQAFFDQLFVITIPADRMFSLRFNGTIYHQFSPINSTDKAFFAVSVHTDETYGLSGELLEKVLARQGSIPLLTEPAPERIQQLLLEPDACQNATIIHMD